MLRKTHRILEDVLKQVRGVNDLRSEVTLTFMEAITVKEVFLRIMDVLETEEVVVLQFPRVREQYELMIRIKNQKDHFWNLIPALYEENIFLRQQIFKSEIADSEKKILFKRYRSTTSKAVKRGMVYSLIIKNFFLELISRGFLQRR